MMKSCSKIKTVVIIQPLKIIKKKPFCKNINRIPKQGLKEINNLRTLSEKLSLSYQESELLTPPTLKKNAKVQFQFKDNNEWRTEQQYLFQDQVQPLVSTTKTGTANLKMAVSLP